MRWPTRLRTTRFCCKRNAAAGSLTLVEEGTELRTAPARPLACSTIGWAPATAARSKEDGRTGTATKSEARMAFAAAVLLCGGVSMTIKAIPLRATVLACEQRRVTGFVADVVGSARGAPCRRRGLGIEVDDGDGDAVGGGQGGEIDRQGRLVPIPFWEMKDSIMISPLHFS